eukprot:CAMPEP_0194288768 /NCGR_PEP_ID=MMETSP0169-20130528/37574_1 /TAXON_ID=218684 /ORGANISM="Corethron pennatum, Strain L29A3" /LENGTH=78 /DNA_ID=CAMNT_0039035865 /DNA_START=647 /DNA_END=880 /DNA_ORIENTATION=-
MAIHYYARTDGGKGDIAGFFYANFPYIDSSSGKSEYKEADLFAIDIDLTTKKMVKCKLDDENLTPSEALTLCWYNTIS